MTSDVVTDAAYGLIPIYLSPEGPRFLLILHNKGHWGFPKGHKETGETDLQAACREFVEETGLTAYELVGNPADFSESYSFTKKSGKRVDKTVKYFLATIPAIENKPPTVTVQPEEVSDYRWCLADEAKTVITFDAARGVLNDCLQFLSQHPL
ncbi:MAG: NUDIX domain-containing protein [Cyanobacteria bacterium P01_A01_bin.3]